MERRCRQHIGIGHNLGPTCATPNDATTKEPSLGTEILDVEAINEGGSEEDEKRAISVDEDISIDVNG
jgi:hypothetical protein